MIAWTTLGLAGLYTRSYVALMIASSVRLRGSITANSELPVVGMKRDHVGLIGRNPGRLHAFCEQRPLLAREELDVAYFFN